MRPKVIVHNSVSVDGCLTGFDVNMALHYQIAGSHGAQAHLVGSRTARSGIELFGGDEEPEGDADRRRPEGSERAKRPWWVIPDSGGRLEGQLHHLRRFEGCRDVVVLIGEHTPRTYLEYLVERDVLHHSLGVERVDLALALDRLAEEYNVNTVLTDGGASLTGALFERGLVDRLSLLIHPQLAGPGGIPLFSQLDTSVQLKLARRDLQEEHTLMVYDVVK